MSYKNIWYVLRAHPHDDGIHRRIVGKFWLHDGKFAVLEDHGMADKELEDLSPEEASHHLRTLAGQRQEVVNADDIRQGFHPHLIEEVKHLHPAGSREALGAQFSSRKPLAQSRFSYHREGMPAPQVLELQGQGGTLDGFKLQPDDLNHILSTVKAGKAKLRHELGKNLGEDTILGEDLRKAADAVKSGHLSPEDFQNLDAVLRSDTLVPSVGNRLAHREFVAKNPGGFHVHVDGSGIKEINQTHGFDVGDSAVAALGRGISEAAAEAVGKEAKVFRVGGDKFVAHVPTEADAQLLARSFRNKLEAVPAIRGQHRLSASIGWGPSSDHARNALLDAKKNRP